MKETVEKSSADTQRRASAEGRAREPSVVADSMDPRASHPVAIAQMRFQALANQSVQAKTTARYQSLLNGGRPEATQLVSKRSKEEEKTQRKVAAGGATAQLEAAPAPRPNHTGLPDRLKAGVESLSGLSMDDVKVHYNSPEPAQLQALAYTQGSEIHVAPGQEQHLPHEAWHVAQQKQGRVQATTQLKGVGLNDDRTLEVEADVMGARAARGPSPEASRNEGPSLLRAIGTGPVQRRPVETIGGTFDTVAYERTSQKAPSMVGLNIELKFTPNDLIVTEPEAIGLVQTAQTMKAEIGKDLEPNYPNKTEQIYGGVSLSKQEGPEGLHVDQILHGKTPNPNPLYASHAEAVQKDPKSNATNPHFGSHGHRLEDGKKKDAVLKDSPSIYANKKDHVVMSFETAALVTTGANSGKYLGSVRWGLLKPSGGKPERNPKNIELVSRGDPSLHFFAAAKKWNEAKGLMPLPGPTGSTGQVIARAKHWLASVKLSGAAMEELGHALELLAESEAHEKQGKMAGAGNLFIEAAATFKKYGMLI